MLATLQLAHSEAQILFAFLTSQRSFSDQSARLRSAGKNVVGLDNQPPQFLARQESRVTGGCSGRKVNVVATNLLVARTAGGLVLREGACPVEAALPGISQFTKVTRSSLHNALVDRKLCRRASATAANLRRVLRHALVQKVERGSAKV